MGTVVIRNNIRRMASIYLEVVGCSFDTTDPTNPNLFHRLARPVPPESGFLTIGISSPVLSSDLRAAGRASITLATFSKIIIPAGIPASL